MLAGTREAGLAGAAAAGKGGPSFGLFVIHGGDSHVDLRTDWNQRVHSGIMGVIKACGITGLCHVDTSY